LFGAWLLSEPLEPSFLLGAVPVLVGIVLVSGGGWFTQRNDPRKSDRSTS
jgi:drug/metabolite transporter (DMT)-like permease